MTDPLTNPAGVAYPPSVQRIAHELHGLDLGETTVDFNRDDLVDALEAAIAADREHRPPPPDLDDEHARRLVSIYLSGMSSGAATLLLNLGVHPDTAQKQGAWIGQRVADDPAVVLGLEEDVRHLWATGDIRRPGWNVEQAHPVHHHPRSHRDD